MFKIISKTTYEHPEYPDAQLIVHKILNTDIPFVRYIPQYIGNSDLEICSFSGSFEETNPFYIEEIGDYPIGEHLYNETFPLFGCNLTLEEAFFYFGETVFCKKFGWEEIDYSRKISLK